MSDGALLEKSKNKAPAHDGFGHRARLRERFLRGGADALADYELIEMLLFSAKPRGDVKPLAKQLIKQFGSFAGVMNASAEELRKIDGVGDAALVALKAVRVSAERLLKAEAMGRPVIQSWTNLLDYCRLSMAHLKKEQLRVLFLNNKNELIADEVQAEGTVDHAPVYPREVVKRALEIGASAVILVHNHPSGDPKPSKSDIDMTRQVVEAARPLGLLVHDHLVMGEKGHFSFKSEGLL